ncbi:MAG: class I SAM-dependent methyltransferase [Pseudomonadales bacterium]|nr:class I SAM-dependent methyltransferase [Pseudomonadales bacterium]MBO6656741.1 class I SAM-dependent methyltransferase [Pseudomonadales bacterium]
MSLIRSTTPSALRKCVSAENRLVSVQGNPTDGQRNTHMKRLFLLMLLWFSAPLAGEQIYGAKTPARDGIGKTYLGREISQVMGHLGAGWLERSDRERVERTDLLLSSLPVDDTSIVADIGAGTGYFSLRLANRVGYLYAVDIQQEMLDIMDARIAASGISNVETVLGTETSPGLQANSVDLIFLVDAYHEFSYPFEMGRAMVEALKPGGQLVLIEYRAEDRRVPIKRLHKMSEAQVVKEMTALGLAFEYNDNVLPQQHFLVFAKSSLEETNTRGD